MTKRPSAKPLPPPYDSWFILAMVLVMAVDIILGVLGVEKKLVLAIRPALPDWFPSANLLIAPILTAVSTLRLNVRIRVELRLVMLLATLASFSLYRLSFDKHPVATILGTLLVYLELFWLVPKWNSRQIAASRSAGG